MLLTSARGRWPSCGYSTICHMDCMASSHPNTMGRPCSKLCDVSQRYANQALSEGGSAILPMLCCIHYIIIGGTLVFSDVCMGASCLTAWRSLLASAKPKLTLPLCIALSETVSPFKFCEPPRGFLGSVAPELLCELWRPYPYSVTPELLCKLWRLCHRQVCKR